MAKKNPSADENYIPPAVAAPWATQAPTVTEPEEQVTPAVAAPSETPADDETEQAPNAPETAPEAPVTTEPTPVDDSAPEAAGKDMVTVTVPKAFRLRVDHTAEHLYKAGIQEMPRAHAEHWYSVANGVTIYTPKG